jgi:hypothetical protein
MRLLIGFLIGLALLAYVESVRSGCSMSTMSGANWLESLAR